MNEYTSFTRESALSVINDKLYQDRRDITLIRELCIALEIPEPEDTSYPELSDVEYSVRGVRFSYMMNDK